MDCLYLVRNGVPFDFAFSLPPDERVAWILAIAGLDGLEFDAAAQAWRVAG